MSKHNTTLSSIKDELVSKNTQLMNMYTHNVFLSVLTCDIQNFLDTLYKKCETHE
jgi:hypothetical protein